MKMILKLSELVQLYFFPLCQVEASQLPFYCVLNIVAFMWFKCSIKMEKIFV